MSTVTPRVDPVPVLNGLLRVLYRSLPMYLVEAKPWVDRRCEKLYAAVTHVAADQRLFAQRLAEAILAHGGRPQPGSFPPQFTSTHDLAVDFLLKRLIENQRRDVQAVRLAAGQLAETPELAALAEEILGNARGHLETLEQALGPGP
jgi:bacterioferritin (cytochrome b1)